MVRSEEFKCALFRYVFANSESQELTIKPKRSINFPGSRFVRMGLLPVEVGEGSNLGIGLQSIFVPWSMRAPLVRFPVMCWRSKINCANLNRLTSALSRNEVIPKSSICLYLLICKDVRQAFIFQIAYFSKSVTTAFHVQPSDFRGSRPV